jgi:hypothetical protein
MKKTLITLITLLTVSVAANADSGIFGTSVVINNNGTTTLYEATLLGDSRHTPTGYSGTTTSGFTGLNLGTYDTTTSDNLTLNGGGMLTYKNNGSDITGAHLYYKIDNGNYSSAIALGFNENLGGGGDQRWHTQDSSFNLLDGLSNGAHTVSVYFDATHDGGTHYENNGSADFTANFTVVPEPNTYALIAGMFGLAYIVLKRRQA